MEDLTPTANRELRHIALLQIIIITITERQKPGDLLCSFYYHEKFIFKFPARASKLGKKKSQITRPAKYEGGYMELDNLIIFI